MKLNIIILCLALLFITSACDTNTSYLESPYKAANVLSEISMEIPDAIIDSKAESLTLSISNLSDKEFYYGAQYDLEKEKEGVWYTYPPKEPIAWIEIAYLLHPYGNVEDKITLYSFFGKLEPGNYRIVKTFVSEDGTQGIAYIIFFVE